jgi:hypothetical protein
VDITPALNFITEHASLIISILACIQLATLVCLAIVAKRSGSQSRRIEALLRTENGGNLEQMVAKVLVDLQQAGQERAELFRQLETLRAELRLAVQGIGVVRYNAFPGVGGEMSFSIAVLNGEQSGFVLTSIFGREEARVYAKEISNGKALLPLSQEEQAAVRRAQRAKWGSGR